VYPYQPQPQEDNATLGFSTLKLLFFLVAIPLFVLLLVIGPCWMLLILSSPPASSGPVWPALPVTLIGIAGMIGIIVALRRFLRSTGA
jgi:hypothetical protein